MVSVSSQAEMLVAQRMLGINQSAQAQTIGQLASGSKVAQTGAAPAAVAVADELNSDLIQYRTNAVNAGHGASVAQVQQGGLQQIDDALIRMRELAAQAGNGALSDDGRAALQEEFSQLREQVTDLAQQTTFNGQSLLDGGGSLSFAVGQDGSDTIDLARPDADATALGLDTANLLTAGDAAAALSAIDGARSSVGGALAQTGASMSRFDTTVQDIAVRADAVSAARSAIADTDLAGASTENSTARALGEASIASLSLAHALNRNTVSLVV